MHMLRLSNDMSVLRHADPEKIKRLSHYVVEVGALLSQDGDRVRKYGEKFVICDFRITLPHNLFHCVRTVLIEELPSIEMTNYY